MVLNKKKFKFCSKDVKFAGLNISAKGVSTSDEILSAIRDFPPPSDIHGICSWYGLVRQVAWTHSLKDEMEPFKELLKKNTKFRWDANLQKLFHVSNHMILNTVKEGVRTLQFGRPTVLQSVNQIGINKALATFFCRNTAYAQ